MSVNSEVAGASSEAEVLAQTWHWVEAAVVGLNLCPFAKSVLNKGQIRVAVSQAKHLDAFLEDLDRELLHLRDCDPNVTDTTLLVHPTLFPDFLVFNDVLDIVDDVLQEHELEGVIQVAPFHPDFVFEGEAEDDMSHFTNRAPYATLHLIREESLERAIGASSESAEDIYTRNQGVLRHLGLEGWRKLMLRQTS